MGYVFLSYSSKEWKMADSFRTLFIKNGIKTWMASRDVQVGASYMKEINCAIKNCACFVLLLSNAAQESPWVNKEIERAINYHKKIIPVQIEKTILNDEFEFAISSYQTVAIEKFAQDSPEMKMILNSIITSTEITSESLITTNGMYLNGQQLTDDEERILTVEDILKLGDKEFLVCVDNSNRETPFDSSVKDFGETHSKAIDNFTIESTISSPLSKKIIDDNQIFDIKKLYPQYTDVQFCERSFETTIYRAFSFEKNMEIAIKVYSTKVAFQIPLFSDGGLFWDIEKLPADNLCPVIDRRLSEPICLIMKYVQGIPLETYIKSAWLWNNSKSIIRLCLGILNGLNTLHSINIYYGDLTPRNIIIDNNNVPWLCDFSESNYNGSRYIGKTVVLEKYYSPERRHGKNIDYRSDIYEFGIILSDFLPFVNHDDITRDALFEIVKKATKENPNERFQSVMEIMDLLNNLSTSSKL